MRYLLTLLTIAVMCSPAYAGRSHYKPYCPPGYKHKRIRRYEPETYAVFGLSGEFMKDNSLIGAELEIGHTLCRGVFIGGDYAREQCETAKNYGFSSTSTPFHITNTVLGASLNLRLINTRSFAMLIGCYGNMEDMVLGNDHLLYTSRNFGYINTYQSVTGNLYFMARPSMTMLMGRNLSFEMGYNYILAGVTSFGNAADFQGFQAVLDVRYDSKKGESRSAFLRYR